MEISATWVKQRNLVFLIQQHQWKLLPLYLNFSFSLSEFHYIINLCYYALHLMILVSYSYKLRWESFGYFTKLITMPSEIFQDFSQFVGKTKQNDAIFRNKQRYYVIMKHNFQNIFQNINLSIDRSKK